jgi:flagellar basal body rod protein FlgB
MDSLTIGLAKFALNMHSIEQMVASKNIANAGIKTAQKVDFSRHLSALSRLSDSQKADYLSVLNDQGMNLANEVTIETNKAVSIEAQHAESTKAMLEYEALIETLNRKVSMTALVIGGR